MTGFLRVGVSGHRLLAEPGQVAADVDAVLDRLVASAAGVRRRPGPSTGRDAGPRPGPGPGPAPGSIQLIAVSSLAEGADRIVAERVLARPGGRLEVLLPLEPDDYATDFADEESRRTFDDLLVAADQVTVIPPDRSDASREGAYARAGTAVLEQCDVLLALWDGQGARGRGGTAEVVAEARAMGRRVEVVAVERAID